jgi:hypothetical protein
MARVSTLDGYFRKTESAKNKGALRNLNPRSQDCCPLYAVIISEGLKFSKTLVAKRNRPAFFFSSSIFSDFFSKMSVAL